MYQNLQRPPKICFTNPKGVANHTLGTLYYKELKNFAQNILKLVFSKTRAFQARWRARASQNYMKLRF